MRTTRWIKVVTGLAAGLALLLFGTVGSAGGRPVYAASDGTPTLPGFQQGTVPIDGGSLHYVRGGSGPVLVLLHGWPETWWSWHDVMPALARDHTVVAFDLPGLGQSSIPSGGFDAATTAQRIHQGVRALGYQQVQLMGHDLGALIAYPYARQYPSEVTRMAVLETPLNGFGLEDAYGLSWHFLFNQAPAPTPENIINDQAHVRTYLGWLFSSAHHVDAIPEDVYFAAYSDPARRSAGYGYYRAFPANATYNKANAATELTIPVLAMGAQYVFGTAVATSFQQVATDVRSVVAPDSGHWIPAENPDFLSQCAELFFGASGVTPPSGFEGCAA